jgi:hypothetical protein
MKIDWKKEWNYQVAQFKGMFHNFHYDIGITLVLMLITIPPIFGMLWLFHCIVGMIA